jgi:hypothetical protein
VFHADALAKGIAADDELIIVASRAGAKGVFCRTEPLAFMSLIALPLGKQ